MIDRRTLLKSGSAAAFGALALTAVASGTNLAQAATDSAALYPDPATTPVPNPPFPKNDRLTLAWCLTSRGVRCRTRSALSRPASGATNLARAAI
jgi:hypothetical protein